MDHKPAWRRTVSVATDPSPGCVEVASRCGNRRQRRRPADARSDVFFRSRGRAEHGDDREQAVVAAEG